MNKELTYKAKDGVEYKYTIKELTLAVKPAWNKILHAINKQKPNFISANDIKTCQEFEERITALSIELDMAESSCKNADKIGRTEAEEQIFQDFVTLYNETEIKLDELKAEKENSEVCKTEMNNFVNNIILSIENALLEEGNEKIYESTLKLLDGDVSKLDLTDEVCFNEVIRPAVVAFFLKIPSN